MTLYTLDEARTSFLRSALDVLERVNTPQLRLARLLSGDGSRRSLAPHERSIVYMHWALIADLQAVGHGWAIVHELEGLLSCLEAEGVSGCAATIVGELPDDCGEDVDVFAA